MDFRDLDLFDALDVEEQLNKLRSLEQNIEAILAKWKRLYDTYDRDSEGARPDVSRTSTAFPPRFPSSFPSSGFS